MTDEPSTELTVTEPRRTEVTVGGDVAGLIPRTIEEAYRLASAFAKSGTAPTSMNTPEKCLVAIMAGAEIGLAPFQAVQGFAIIGQRPVLWGDAFLAVIRSKGIRVREWIEGEEDDRVAWCEMIRPDTGEVTARKFSVGDARRANLWGKSGPWTQYPERMLQMRARAFCGRDAAADVLKGYAMREEVDDYAEVRNAAPATSGLRARLEATPPSAEGFNAENAPTIDAILEGDNFPVAEVDRPEVVDGPADGDVVYPHPDDMFPGDRPRK